MSTPPAAAPASSAPLSAACPGCAKPVDALRAGHVAIYDGVFLYYCNATCKAVHLRTIASHLGDDVPTLDPPAVAERALASVVEASASRTNGQTSNGRAHTEVLADELARFEPPELEAPIEPPPSTLESPQLPPSPASPPPISTRRSEPPVRASSGSNRDHALTVASVTGGIAGVLVPLLVIADVGLGARLALAALAVGCLLARLALTERDAADASTLVAAVPAIGMLVAACASYLANDPHASRIVALAGLSASVSIGVEEAIARARSGVYTARRRIAAALDVTPSVLRPDGATEPRRDVKAGETVVVEAGEIVGVDGVVSAGTAVVVPWHGAAIEAQKAEGDAIVAGARVVSGRLCIVASWAGAERSWTRAISSASVRPDVSAPLAVLTRLLIERAAPAVAVLAGLAAMASGEATGWGEVLAAVCASSVALGGGGVVAAVALVQARAHARALAHGIVYRDARSFDTAGRVATAVACSRGTVLTGEPEIVALEQIAASGASESRILALAAGAETASTHPLANAIRRAARTRGVSSETVRSATVHAGLGITALASSGDRLVVGSRALLLQEQVSVAVAETRASELEAQGRSVLLVALGGKLVGLVALQDGLRAGARAAVQRLLDTRIEPVLLSGESRETCATIARALEIDHVRPEVLPSDRGAEVRALAEGGHLVAVIGHPASDDGALGAADVAVAMGAPRTASDWGVWLASDDVRDAALALSIAHGARDRSRSVLAAGLAPGAVALLAIAFGVAPLFVGPLALAVGVGSCLAVALGD